MRHVFGFLAASLLLLPLPGRAVITITATPLTEAAVNGYPYRVLVTVYNSAGSGQVSVGGITGAVSPIARGSFWFSEGNQSGPQGTSFNLADGGRQQIDAFFYPVETGAADLTYTAVVAGYPYVLVHITIVDALSSRPPAKGTMEIRHNIVRRSHAASSTTVPALVILHGEPGGTVNLVVTGASGSEITTASGVTLDSAGYGTYVWNTPYDTGTYWIVATGAVKDRKPVLVLTSK